MPFQMDIELTCCCVGGALLADAPQFAPAAQSSEAQRKQFGYNCDYIAFFTLPGARRRRALVCVNHEYTIGSLMFDDYANVTAESCTIERAAHGVSIVEIELVNDVWRVVPDSGFNRRISADTPMVLTGPAAGHARLATIDDPTGRAVVGTFNNCAGGETPWGAYLAAEENINAYFLGVLPDSHQEARPLVGEVDGLVRLKGAKPRRITTNRRFVAIEWE